MNERIKELAIRAGFGPKWTESTEPGTPANINEMVVREFAELIIGECTETVRQVLREEGSTLSYDDASKIQKQIKEYFGVK